MTMKTKPATGKLLIAEPMMQDENFRRTVVLLCEHTEQGTFGLVLNKELPLTLNDVLPGENLPESPLYLGGPVQPDTLHVVHRAGNRVEGATEVSPGIWWGGKFDDIRQILLSGEVPESYFRFFLGYSGWGEGQLDGEIAQGGWILTGCRPEFVFGKSEKPLWRQVLKKMGGDYAVLSNFPDDPQMN